MSKKKISLELILQLSRFGIVGILATLTHYFTALISHDTFMFSYYFANLAGYTTAIFVSFVGQTFFTFKKSINQKTIFKFLIVSITTFLLSEGLLFIMTNHTAASFKHAMVVVVFSIPLITFIMQKFWVYK